MANSVSDSGSKQNNPETKSQEKHSVKSASSIKGPVAQKPQLSRKPSATYPFQHYAKLIMVICLIAVFGSIAIFGWNFYARTHIRKPKFYTFPPVAGSEEPPWQEVALPINPGKLQPLQGLDHPNLNTSVLLQWATNAATASLTFNFYNYRQVLEEARSYFTPPGYVNFLKALDTITATVVKKQLAVYSVVTDTPIVLKEGPITGGGYAWQVQFPMLLTYESEKTSKLHVIITLLIASVPPSVSPQGVGIAAFVMQVKTGGGG